MINKTLENMLSYASLLSETDAAEGDILYDMLAPVSMELEKRDVEIQNIEKNYFIDTATGIYLDRLCSMMGIERKEASFAFGTVTITGSAGTILTNNMYVSSDSLNFRFTESVTIPEDGSIDIVCICTTVGKQGNVVSGSINIVPTALLGVLTVVNSSAFSGGMDTESDDELRDRYYQYVSAPVTSGNVQQYVKWAMLCDGVGSAKCIPCPNNSPGIVNVIVCDNDKKPMTSITGIQNFIESMRPIGASVTVLSATEKSITVSANIKYDTSYDKLKVNTDIKNAVIDYFKSIALSENVVSIAKIGAIIINTNGVLDYSLLKLNNASANIIMTDKEIPVLNSSTIFTEVTG